MGTRGWCVGTRECSQQSPGCHSHISSAWDALQDTLSASVSPCRTGCGVLSIPPPALQQVRAERQQLPPSPPKIGEPQILSNTAPTFCPAATPNPRLTIALYYCNKCSHKSGRYWRAQRSLLLSYGNVISSVPGKFYKIVSGGIINRISSPPPPPLPTHPWMRQGRCEGHQRG